jgi:hypothetical protein
MSISDDANTLLLRLAQREKSSPELRDEFVTGPDLDELIHMGPHRLNDAVAHLESNGYLEVLKTFGTDPYDFNSVTLTSRGRFEAEQLAKDDAIERKAVVWRHGPSNQLELATMKLALMTTKAAQPVGSPYGFTAQDWEAVSLDHEDDRRLIVVFGHKWESSYFDSDLLRKNLEAQVKRALVAAQRPLAKKMALDFRPLAAGYGEHLFNQIAKDIISADIAIFETSDLNHNVMIEMGVALTWGTRVLPIRRLGAPDLPSDISGQTYAYFDDNGLTWSDVDHDRKLAKMVERACKLKPRRG